MHNAGRRKALCNQSDAREQHRTLLRDDRASEPGERGALRGLNDVGKRAYHPQVGRKPDRRIGGQSRLARWRRRYLNARAMVALIVLLGLLAAEVAAILNPTG
jgi:hypothetical protein